MASWPGTLPPPMVASFNSRQTPRMIKTAMDSGPQRLTLYSAHKQIFGSASVALDLAQMQAFNQMYEEARLGADWIDGIPLDTGLGTAPHAARITSVQYAVLRPPDVYWRITFTFEARDQVAP